MGWFSDLGKGIGNFINDITGVSSSAKKQNKASMAMQKDAQAYTTWQMQNAHQTEVQDLKNAGLNPVLSADGGGAGGTPAMNSAQQGVGTDPISMIATIINTANNSARTNADIDKINATIKNETNMTDANVIKALADAKKAGADEKQIQNMIDYYKETGFFPGATLTTSTTTHGPLGIGGGSSTTRPISAKKIKERNQIPYNVLNKNKNPKNK